jgi:transposase
MQVLYERCCGLDIHKKTVVACVVITSPEEPVQKHVRTFATTTTSLLALADWLTALQISHIALESTGIYWRPVFNLLEEGRTIILVNAQHMKAITTDSPQWKHSRLDSRRRGDRSGPCVVRPAIAVA